MALLSDFIQTLLKEDFGWDTPIDLDSETKPTFSKPKIKSTLIPKIKKPTTVTQPDEDNQTNASELINPAIDTQPVNTNPTITPTEEPIEPAVSTQVDNHWNWDSEQISNDYKKDAEEALQTQKIVDKMNDMFYSHSNILKSWANTYNSYVKCSLEFLDSFNERLRQVFNLKSSLELIYATSTEREKVDETTVANLQAELSYEITQLQDLLKKNIEDKEDAVARAMRLNLLPTYQNKETVFQAASNSKYKGIISTFFKYEQSFRMDRKYFLEIYPTFKTIETNLSKTQAWKDIKDVYLQADKIEGRFQSLLEIFNSLSGAINSVTESSSKLDLSFINSSNLTLIQNFNNFLDTEVFLLPTTESKNPEIIKKDIKHRLASIGYNAAVKFAEKRKKRLDKTQAKTTTTDNNTDSTDNNAVDNNTPEKEEENI